MRILSHYTICDGSVFHLHVFDIDETSGSIAHFPVTEETAHTLFLQGILVIGHDIFSLQKEINAISSRIPDIGLGAAARQIALLLHQDRNASQKSEHLAMAQIVAPNYICQKLSFPKQSIFHPIFQ